MTSIWTNMECVYSMAPVGATKTTTTVQVVTLADAAQFSLSEFFPVGPQMLGKALRVKMAGSYDATAVANTMTLGLNTTQGTAPPATVLAVTGAVTVPAATTGIWIAEVDLVCQTVGSNTSGWVSEGTIGYATAYNGTTAMSYYPFSGVVAAGIATAVAIVPTTVYYWELSSLWGTAPTAFVCNKFKIFADN